MNLNLEQKIVREIVIICHKYEHINKVILFGSRAREDNSIKSDIDLAKINGSSISWPDNIDICADSLYDL